MRVRYFTILLGLSLCGCSVVQDYHYCFTQKHRADVAFKESYGFRGGASRDYADGWKQGYYDVSMGQCEEPPPVPPHKYWHARYQSLDGKAAIDDWYSGWQDGATAAVQDGRPFFHPIVASPMPPVDPYNPSNFHCGPKEELGPGLEKLPPAEPMATTHAPQPRVYVAPVPERFASDTIEGELLDEADLQIDAELLDEEDVLDATPAAAPYVEQIEIEQPDYNDPYYSAPPTGYDADDSESLDAGEYE